jgi:hypothetical protein
VDLSLVSAGDIYTGTVVAFSADIAPDSAGKPYTYTIDYDDGHTATSTGSEDPLTTALSHTFDAAGIYDVEIKVWNCDMTEAQARTDSVRVVVTERPVTCDEVTGTALALLTSGDIYTDTLVAFSADIAPDSAGKPYTYTIDYDDGHTTTSTSSDDPLTTVLNHTFDAVGTYDVEIKVWNCDMTEAQAATDSARVVVDEYGEDYTYIYLPLVMRSR